MRFCILNLRCCLNDRFPKRWVKIVLPLMLNYINWKRRRMIRLKKQYQYHLDSVMYVGLQLE